VSQFKECAVGAQCRPVGQPRNRPLARSWCRQACG